MFLELWSYLTAAAGQCLGVASLLIGVAGLVTGYVQWRRNRDITRWRRQHLLASIHRASQLIIPDHTVREIVAGDTPRSREAMRHWLYSVQKGASDNYSDAVFSYLTLEDRFTYDDLERARRAGLINSPWQEQLWRSLIALRDENREAATMPPDPQSAPALTTPDSAARLALPKVRHHKRPVSDNGAGRSTTPDVAPQIEA